MGASGSRGFMFKWCSVMVWRLSQAITSEWCLVARAAAMVLAAC